ncbi:MAG: DUF1610 domain-containing protein [Candidatus Micrarchaeota archaeon]|nr:DUF1610 domain-containing protein [Candidatus Micrarchaeota archaeon]
MELRCTNCNISLVGQDNFVKFKCPSCGEGLIIRCSRCKRLSNPYKCEKCGFEGP